MNAPAYEAASAVAPATRAEGLRRLAAFVPRAGSAYRNLRNHDLGPGRHEHVSMLSPWIRHRLLTEAEVAVAVLDRFSLSSAEKFVQEVCWRTYWKGWLEMRPGIWDHYRRTLRGELDTLEKDGLRADGYERAVRGETGIACFDAWAQELLDTGYVHNHARMWFASIWIFTLELPWQLGADFFYRHLLDGDPASNTLSWRWVAGLQTRGKHYLARPDNIAKYTDGRFPRTAKLNTRARALAADEADVAAQKRRPLPEPQMLPPAGPCALLLTEEDLHPESLGLAAGDVRAVAALAGPAERSPLPVSETVREFVGEALDDGLQRAAEAVQVAPGPRLEQAQDVVAWARESGVRQVVTPRIPAGPTADRIAPVADALEAEGIALVQLTREWDAAAWPHATHGFFRFRGCIPALVGRG